MSILSLVYIKDISFMYNGEILTIKEGEARERGVTIKYLDGKYFISISYRFSLFTQCICCVNNENLIYFILKKW